MKLHIGIDPGRHNGVAVWSSPAFHHLHTLSFHALMKFIDRQIETAQAMETPLAWYVEDPTKNRPTFRRKLKTESWDEHLRMRDKISQNVGENKGIAKLIIEYLESKDQVIHRLRPTRSKLNAEQFKRLTGQKGRTNEHKRDAAMLVFGR